MATRSDIRVASAIAQAEGFQVVGVAHGAKHVKLILCSPTGQRRWHPVPHAFGTNWRNPMNFRSELRRLARELEAHDPSEEEADGYS